MSYLRNMSSTSYHVFEAPNDQGISAASVTVTPFDGNAAAEVAKALALEMSDDTLNELDVVASAKEDAITGTVQLMVYIQKDFGPEKMEAFPRPDTDTGNNRSKFDIEEVVNGKTATKKADFYNILADNTKRGRELHQRLDWVKRAGDSNANQSGIPDDIATMTFQQRNMLETQLSSRIKNNRVSVKKAIALHFQFLDVNDLPHIVAEPLWEGDAGGQVVTSAKPIAVWQVPDAGKPVTKWLDFGIGAFLRIDADKASENGGDFKAVMSTLKKKPAGQPETPTAEPAIKSLDTGVGRLVELHRWFDSLTGPGSDQSDYGKLLKLVNHKAADELVTTIVELSKTLEAIRRECKLDARYVKLQQTTDLTSGPVSKAN